MNRVRVDTVEEAVLAAEQLASSGRTYWFRGQAKLWPVQSSFVRLKEEGQKAALEQLARYASWVDQTPGLESLRAHTDAMIAVAQHYSLPTNFIDFTTQPQIAGFFASEKARAGANGELGCIICVDVEDLKSFWQSMLPSYPAPEFLQLQVPDLWRLEAQRGCFMFCPYDGIEKFYDFDRIVFPNTHVLRPFKRGDVYPERKSQLEILLDQYFMNEQLIIGNGRLNSMQMDRIRFETPEGGCDPEVFPCGLPDHESWNDAAIRPWLELRPEQLAEAQTSVAFTISVPGTLDAASVVQLVSDQLLQKVLSISDIRTKLVNWQIVVTGSHELPQDFSGRLAPKLTALWDGLRRLPHTDEDVSLGLGMCVALAMALRGEFQDIDVRHWEQAAESCLRKPVELEFGADDGSYSRGFASSESFMSALRPDILSHMSMPWKEQLRGSLRNILLVSYSAKKTFDFRLLAPIFAREIAPFQALIRTGALFYSPARLDTLGLP